MSFHIELGICVVLRAAGRALRNLLDLVRGGHEHHPVVAGTGHLGELPPVSSAKQLPPIRW